MVRLYTGHLQFDPRALRKVELEYGNLGFVFSWSFYTSRIVQPSLEQPLPQKIAGGSDCLWGTIWDQQTPLALAQLVK